MAAPPAAQTTALAAVQEDVRALNGLLNGNYVVVPTAASAGYVAPANRLVLVRDVETAPGQYNALAQYDACRLGGTPAIQAAALAGARLGWTALLIQMGWKVRVTNPDAVAGVAAAGELPSDVGPGVPGLVLEPVVDQAVWEQVFDRRIPQHADRLPSLATLGMARPFPLRIRADEVVYVPGTHAVQNAHIAELQQADVLEAFKSCRDAVSSLAFIIAFHMARSGGHHFITNLRDNQVMGLLRALIPAAKLGLPQADLVAILHDLLHVFAGIPEVIHALMQSSRLIGMVNRAVLFRYPFIPTGAAALYSVAPVIDVIRMYVRTHHVREAIVGMRTAAGNAVLVFEQIAAKLEGMRRHVDANIRAYLEDTQTADERTQALSQMAVVRRMAAVLMAMAMELDRDTTATWRNARSLIQAVNADAGARAYGQSLAMPLRVAAPKAALSLAEMGYEAALNGLPQVAPPP